NLIFILNGLSINQSQHLPRACLRYVEYFITACILDFERSIALVVLTSLAVVSKCIFLCGLRVCCGFFRVFVVAVLVLLVTWLVVDTSKRPEQLISFGGVCMFILVIFIFSAHRTEVAWRSVFWGLGLQFCIGPFVIRTEPGLTAFQWLGEQVQIFLNYTKHGSSFVFGPLVSDIFAFQALPIVIFFSSVMSVLYFLRIMQWLIIKIAWVMQITMGTSPTETLCHVLTFISYTEAPLLIRPYLKDMTKSEVHAVMVGGFATIAGSVMGAFISFEIDASSMISASVMAAPCALAISKLSYPETEEKTFLHQRKISKWLVGMCFCVLCLCVCVCHLPIFYIPLHFVAYIIDFLWFILGCLNSPVMNRTFWKQLAVEHLHQ
uniref:Solute carrier family 28 member 1 n=1 Tax=Oncorhynchus tshawytscha TaxID=74940 RepID=A0A8C8GCZ6_ONCTS